MKIGIYAPFYAPFEGGAERVVRRVAQALVRQHDVTVLTLRFDPSLPDHEQDGAVRLIRVPYTVRRPFGLTWIQAPRLTRVIREIDLDVLQIQGVTFPNVALSVIRAARRRQLPTVLVPHGVFEAYDGDARQARHKRLLGLAVVRPLLAGMFCSASHLALSSPEERRFLNRFRVPAGRSTVVYNGFERPNPETASARRFREAHGLTNERVILHVASVKPNKGHDIMLQAMQRLSPEFPDLRYVAIGSLGGLWSEYASGLQARAARLLGDQVMLLGYQTDEQLADAYAASDIVVLASLAETFPLSALDAMAWGKPLVATRVGGITHMVTPSESGLLVPPDDAMALADALATVLRDPDGARAMGTRASEVVRERFDWDRVVERYEDVCRRLLTSKHGASQRIAPPVEGALGG